MRIILFLGFLAISMLVPVGLAEAQVPPDHDLAQAEVLIRGGKAEEAWALLSPHEFERAGQEDFDYLLGLAALDSGRADRATLVFERVLAVNPDHAAARLDMARAYFALGDFQRSREEFDQVRKDEETPKAAQATIERYLAAIEERTPKPGVRLNGYVEASLGRDSNVSGATASGSVYVPLFNVNFTLGANSQKAVDSFHALGGGAELNYAFSNGMSLFAGADLRQRRYRDWDIYDNSSIDYRVGYQVVHDKNTFRLTAERNDYSLDHAAYRRIGSLGLELRHAADANTQWIGFGQASEIKYLQDRTASYSSDQIIVGLGVVKSMPWSGNPLLFGSIYTGEDVATQNRGDGDRLLHGLRGGVQQALKSDIDIFAILSMQYSKYNRLNILFQEYRKETQYDVGLGLNWRFERDWLLKPQLTYTRNNSNLPIYDYDRYEFSLTLRRDFH